MFLAKDKFNEMQLDISTFPGSEFLHQQIMMATTEVKKGKVVIVY
jgi:hypothetical protein